MLFAVLFEDNDDAVDQRAAHMQAHLDFLRTHPAILKAGPLRSGTAGAGGLWLVDADDPQEVEALVRRDPFWPTGLRKSHRVLTWNLVHDTTP